MITLHILQRLQEDGFGAIDTDLFWEKLPLDKTGVAIFSRGAPLSIGRRSAAQNFDLYSRGTNDLNGADKLEKLWEWMVDEYTLCDLPIVPGKSNKLYMNARIVPISNVENLGLDENDRLVFRLAAEVIYNKP